MEEDALIAPGGIGWITTVTVDSVGPERLARFWADLLGLEVRPVEDDRYVASRRPPASVPELVFQRVPEPKDGKVRIRLDIGVHDINAAIRREVQLGGSLADDFNNSDDPFVVMRDVESNEFCLIPQSRPVSMGERESALV